MRYIYTVLFFLLLFYSSCRTKPAYNDQTLAEYYHPNAVMNTSEYTANVYIGISPRMRLPEAEVDAAKRHIAHQVAMRDTCIIDLKRMNVSAGRNSVILSDSNLDYEDPYIEELLENIEVIQIYNFNEIIIVIGMDTGKPSAVNKLIPRQAAERPRWIDNPEWVRTILGEGYYVGVGIAEKYSMYYRGIFFADLGAAHAIASEKQTYTYINLHNSSESRVSYLDARTLTLTENVKLEDFYILDRWIEPDGSNYYSLGIARTRK